MKWTIAQFAREMGIDDETLKRRIVAAGHEVKQGQEFQTKTLVDAYLGSLQREKIRLTSADADLKERERLELDGVLIRADAAKKLIAETLGPIRSTLVAWPAVLSARCNPGDPELARGVLSDAVKNLLNEGK